MNELKRPLNKPLLVKRILLGAALGLALVLFFVLRVDASPSWPQRWWTKPVVITPIAGACGGIVTYFLSPLLYKKTWQKMLGIIATVLIYAVALWIGFILGMDGTMWN